MANIKELRGRIRSVANIAKITRAMEMVASMKLRRVQSRALSFRPYTEELQGLLGHLAEHVGHSPDRPLFQEREIKSIGVMLFTSDRGLCGAYNANVLAGVTRLRADLKARGLGDGSLKFFVVGRKGYSWLNRRGLHVERYYADPTLEALDFATARLASRDLVEAFTSAAVDEVRIMFTAFESVVRFVPRDERFLPVTVELGDHAGGHQNGDRLKGESGYLLEPSPHEIFSRILPKYLETVIFDAMLSSLASEMASRRMAMKGATDAATRMNKELKRVYNRARQESITKELLDIVGGANAVQ
ncbi:MAG: ATP synthase F1 subunit gamma [Planctomycetes bacterium]|nr:ATP synthase F1 subunit gamma [Planctomycetota bacterium]